MFDCGNGVLEAGEQCDDGNTSNTDACLNTCVAARCGDGLVEAGVEACDLGAQNSNAPNAACRTDFIRTWIDGRPMGYHLLIEQPNKAFLRHNGLRADGNLYKCQWFGQGVVGQHEKKTHIHEGHGDLVNFRAGLRFGFHNGLHQGRGHVLKHKG